VGQIRRAGRLPGPAGQFEELVRAYYDQVWRLCALLVDPPSADDLAQETFLRALRSFPSFRGSSSVRTWLFSVARHTCLDELRSRSRGRRVPPLWQHTTSEPSVQDPATDVVVNDLLGSLDPDRRAAFVLTQVFGLSYAEAARVCACPIGTIRSRLARARKDLVAAIDHEGTTVPARDTGTASADPGS